jgi:hypothetical protein
MDLGEPALREINQAQKDKHHMSSHVKAKNVALTKVGSRIGSQEGRKGRERG